MTAAIDIATVWAFIIAFAVFVYVVMDGFDLGLGILFPLFPKKSDRDVIMNSVAPVWDGNETWLVLGGGGMMAAFPLAYAILMPALYTPMIAMLIGLVFRGVAFEFRWRTTTERAQSLGHPVHLGIAAGGTGAGRRARRHPAGRACRGAALCRRLVGLADAVQHPDRHRTGDRLCAAGRDLADHEDRGPLRDKAYHLSWFLLFAMIGAIGAVSIATPFLHIQYTQRWFTWPGIILTAPVPVAVAGGHRAAATQPRQEI